MNTIILRVWLILTAISFSAKALTKDEINFFETKIRPVLAQNCYKCHSKESEKVKGGLILDNAANTQKGGVSGPAVVPSDLAKSLLYKSLTYKDKDLQMPPAGKLSDTIIADFKAWIEMGAPDPRIGSLQVASGKLDEIVKTHWSYQPVKKPEIPEIKIKWGYNDIDKFILKKQIENNLLPSLEADRKLLARRLYYDLLGLPPTTEEVKRFLADTSENAYEKLVDQLLSSKLYGERWGRYWLDSARYSDTSGSVNRNREDRFTYSYTYRNYVIRSFNEDKPYDQFIIEQIAADKIPNIQRENLAALGFLTLGKDSQNINDVIDDRIDVVMKSFMGITAVCARCHDHKFDPVSTKDYYALHGVFNSSFVPSDANKPLLRPIKEDEIYKDYLAKQSKIEADIEAFIDKNYVEAFLDFSSNTAKFLHGAYILNTLAQSNRTDYVRDNKLNSRMMQRWTQSIKITVPIGNKSKQKEKNSTIKVEHPVFLPYAKMFEVTEENFSAKFKTILNEHSENINPFFLSKLKSASINKMQDLAMVYGRAVSESRGFYNNTNVIGAKDFYEAIFKNNGPLDINRDNFQKYYADNGRTMRFDNQLREERKKITTNDIQHPGSPAKAMALLDKDQSSNSYVFIKGEPSSRGPIVERRFFSFLSHVSSEPFKNGSGRLELAKAIASPLNPLTARVMVNRIWQRHFDEGFVKTPDDFGTQSEKPVHVELINYLAAKFMEEGWSIKKLHRLILTSATYRQCSAEDHLKAAIDPYNKYLWRMNIIRLDFESLRDTILYLGNNLNLEPLNQAKDLFTLDGESFSNHRSVYGLVDRSRLPEALTTFDFATPEMTTGKRFKTTVAKQALFLMNNALIVEQARNIVTRSDFVKENNDDKKIEILYSVFYQRSPSELEKKVGKHYLKSAKLEDMSNVRKEYDWRYGFRVASGQTLGNFIELDTFSKGSYSSSTPALKGLEINAAGGKIPGLSVYPIRQWKSPRAGEFSITMQSSFKALPNEKLNCSIIVYKNDSIFRFVNITNYASQKIEIPSINSGVNDKLEFAVAGYKKRDLDYLLTITITEKRDENSLSPIVWTSSSDFRGPIRKIDRELDAWERYAHILLMSNEMVFIN
jgi:hypothetical protein